MAFTICGWRPRFTYFGVYGSVMPVTFPICLLSGFFCFSLMYWNVIKSTYRHTPPGEPYDPATDDGVSGGKLMWHPNVYIFFISVVSLVCAFHVNAAYGRFWEGRGALQRIGTAWSMAAATIVNMDTSQTGLGGFTGHKDSDDGERDGDEHIALKAYVLHMLSLLHASGLTWLLTSDNRYGRKGKVAPKGDWLEVLGSVSKAEARQLALQGDREFWLLNELLKTMSVYKSKKGEGVPAGASGRFIAQVSDGFGGFETCRKIEDTSFPFAYVQILFWLQIMVFLVTPVIVACWMRRIPLAVVLTCMLVFTFNSIFLAAHRMESPFGYSSTNLPSLQLHNAFIDRLQSLCDARLGRALELMAAGDDNSADLMVRCRGGILTAVAASDADVVVAEKLDSPRSE
eukprot:Lankesteria_metandrocarpae@DN2025_c0_g1_i1.p1